MGQVLTTEDLKIFSTNINNFYYYIENELKYFKNVFIKQTQEDLMNKQQTLSSYSIQHR
jgi:hypothetical protein